MKLTKIFIVSWFLFIVGTSTGLAQNGVYHFAGDLQQYQKADGIVTFQLSNGAVKIAYLKGVGFRIRYSFSGKFAPLFSYAVVNELPPETNIKISNSGNALSLKPAMRFYISKSSLSVSRMKMRTVGHL